MIPYREGCVKSVMGGYKKRPRKSASGAVWNQQCCYQQYVSHPEDVR
jgi:hypothetical protein